jgi:uncharacterized protein with ParB-like and HNH nuclease domain
VSSIGRGRECTGYQIANYQIKRRPTVVQKIESDKWVIKEVFQKWFRIPEYQRPYVWGPDQITELLDDIYQAQKQNKDSQYFIGSMVLQKKETDKEGLKYLEYDVLDGQQRLITLLLLTAVVRDLTPQTDQPRRETCRDTIYKLAKPDDNEPERVRIVFDIREKVKEFIDEYVKRESGTEKEEDFARLAKKKEEDISVRNMASAILTIRSYFKNGKSINEVFPYLRSNVLMIHVTAEELEDAFHLFTVMNNRGVRLRNSDILKAENLSKVKSDIERVKYAKNWETIEEYFGEDFDNFLSHLRTIVVKTKANISLLKEYEDNIYSPKEYDPNTKLYNAKPPLLQKGNATFDFIDRYFEHYQALFENNNFSLENNYEFDNLSTLMLRGLEADYWKAALLKYYDKFKTNNLLEFLKALDNKFSADWIIGLSPTARIENINSIIKQIDKTQVFNELITSDVFGINKGELGKIISGGIYGRGFARYLLLKTDLLYHGHTSKFVIPETISIEHILPQNPDSSSQWVKDFSEADRQSPLCHNE